MQSIEALDVFLHGSKIGRLAVTPDGLCAFEYDSGYLRDGASISPFHLPLTKDVFVAKRTPFEGGFGVFDDSLPDGWGRLLFDRYLKKKGLQNLSLLQRLAFVGTTGRGALEYFPDFSEAPEHQSLEFASLAKDAEKILTSEYSGKGLETLYRQGGSPGGARPKIFVVIDNAEWLVKFCATNDPPEIGEMEFQFSLLAKKCGIDMPETRLFEGKYFGVKRFDRATDAQGVKIHTISAAGLLNANYREPSLDYEALLQACFMLAKDMREVEKLFRLMVFNVAIKNRDDHAKNFSFQLIDREWRLSPGYDLLPSHGFNGYHTTTVNGSGEPTWADVEVVGDKVGIKKRRMKEITEHVRDTVGSK